MTNQEKTQNESIITDSESIEFERKLALAVKGCKFFQPEYETFIKKYNCPGNPKLISGILTALEQNAINPLDHTIWDAFDQVILGYIANIEEFEEKNKLEDPVDASLAIYALEVIIDTIRFLQSGYENLIEFLIEVVEKEEE